MYSITVKGKIKVFSKCLTNEILKDFHAFVSSYPRYGTSLFEQGHTQQHTDQDKVRTCAWCQVTAQMSISPL